MYTAGDVEVHLSAKDGRFYVLDLQRLFPAVTPKPKSKECLYLQFRPEFIAKHPKPLSSDVFSRWGEHDHQVHNKEARDAFQQLQNETIPVFVKEFLHKLQTLEKQEDLDAYERKDGLITDLHTHGINVRYLGRVFDLLPEVTTFISHNIII